MEKEKLIIRNFGPIKSVELDLGRFNILIGEQATGKSTVAKVLAVCRYFSYIVNISEMSSLLDKDDFRMGLGAWGLSEYLKVDSYIAYECRHYSLTYKRFTYPDSHYRDGDDEPTEFVQSAFSYDIKPLSSEFENLLSELKKIKPQDLSWEWAIPTSFFLNDVKKVMDNPFYFPTERGLQSIFSLGQGSLPNLANFLYKYYSKVDGIFQSFKTETEIEPLNIIYINRNGRGYIRKKEETEFYLLANAASGYQSTIPIILIMKFYELQKRKKTFIIEEPELNLFPSAQDKVMQYLVNKTIGNDNTVLLTTHSPYVLASVNNLIYAHIVGQSHKEDVNNIIPEKYWLDPSLVSAYRLLPDGTVRNIIDEDLNEVVVEELDSAGKEINAVYDKILDVKFMKNEESE